MQVAAPTVRDIRLIRPDGSYPSRVEIKEGRYTIYDISRYGIHLQWYLFEQKVTVERQSICGQYRIDVKV